MSNSNRDNFSEKVKTEAAKKVGYLCSNPNCRRPTVAATEDNSRSMSIGVAAHICAAAPGGPRYDATMGSEERKSESNAIWMCQSHSVMIDRDELAYPTELLREWKKQAEQTRNIEMKYGVATNASLHQNEFNRLKNYIINLEPDDKKLLNYFLKNNNKATILEDHAYHGVLIRQQESWFDIIDKFQKPHRSMPIKNTDSTMIRMALPYPVLDHFTELRLNFEIYELLKQLNEMYGVIHD